MCIVVAYMQLRCLLGAFYEAIILKLVSNSNIFYVVLGINLKLLVNDRVPFQQIIFNNVQPITSTYISVQLLN